jgi:hypothetical protein
MRTAATTAVVVGTAKVVGGAMDSHAANKQAEQQAQYDQQQAAADQQQAAADQQAAYQQQQYEMQQMQAQMAQMQQQQQMQAQMATQQAPAAPPPAAAAPAPAAGGLTNDDLARLKQLSDLHTAGALSDAEFEAAKQKILG